MAALGAAMSLAVACGDDTDGAPAEGTSIVDELGGTLTVGQPTPGGTLRVGISDLPLSANLDPTGEYALWSVLRLVGRPLLGYRGVGGPEGSELIPDAAAALPEVSADELTYTFRLRDGIRFGPPLDRPVTSRDYVTALERIATPGLAQYPGYYAVIDGFEAATTGAADRISGLRTPDDRTLVVRLREPRGDFAYAMSLPASAPIPAEVASCHTGPGEYGPFQISSGPYMLEGSERLDVSSCASQDQIAGYRPSRGITLVRNPAYDPESAEAGVRPNYADRVEFTVDANIGDLFAKVERGELDTSLDKPPTPQVRRLLDDPTRRQQVRVNAGDTVWWLSMNLTEPPFDDVHVRKALSLAMDLDGLRRAWGGPVQGEIATDIVPDNLLPGRLPTSEYQPLQKAPFDGDLDAAAAEMKLSRYDTDKDGRCDAAPCSDAVVIMRNLPAWRAMTPVIRQSARAVGLDVTIRELPIGASYAITASPRRGIAIAGNGGGSKDYSDPATIFTTLDGASILPDGNINTSLVGITPAIAKQVGVTLPAEPVPSIDDRIDECSGLAGDPRLDCWEALDRTVSEDIVPYIPYLDATRIRMVGPSVTAYDYDQGYADIAIDHIAVDPAKQN